MQFLKRLIILTILSTQVSWAQSELLWQITSQNSTHISYLYGTIHSGDSRLFPIDSIVYKSLLKCEVLALELNPSKMNDIKLLKKMLLKEKTLEDLYSSKNYKTITKFLKDSLNISVGMVNNMQPIFIDQLIDQSIVNNTHDPIDIHLYKNALINNISILGIETIDEQMNTLLSISIDKQAKDLIEKIKKFNRVELLNEMDSLIEAYVNQNIENFLEKELKKTKKGKEEFEEKFIYSRNKTMTERTVKIVNKNNAFVAVGAAHLYGEKGIVSLLKKEGLVLKPLY